jgi:rare lipoprotein A (peptidoglycan hydrolase)
MFIPIHSKLALKLSGLALLVLAALIEGCSAISGSFQGSLFKPLDTEAIGQVAPAHQTKPLSTPLIRNNGTQGPISRSRSRIIGEASWYGPGFNGKTTASGDVFDKEKMTAAHKTLPLGSKARVTNLANEKSVEVEINDRGPFVEGRIIDLSQAAARALGMIDEGKARVQVELLEDNKETAAEARSTNRR